MSNATDLALVIELACLTEDRSNEEQHALLRVAAKLDNELNALVVTNKRMGPPSELLLLAAGTRVLDVGQRHVGLSAKQHTAWLHRVERWARWQEPAQQALRSVYRPVLTVRAEGERL